MGDPDRTLTERVVEDPAGRATAYGDAAVQQGVRVAQGGPKPPPKKKAPAAPTDPPHVRTARRLWQAALGKEPRFANVRIGDLKAHSDRHRAKRPDVGKLAGAGFSAWTNSARDIYVAPSLLTLEGVPMPDWYAEMLLRHEAEHVEQFARVKDEVPTYSEMLKAEAEAHTKALAWLDTVNPLPAELKRYDKASDTVAALATLFGDRHAVQATELEHRTWMVEDVGALPEHQPVGDPPRPRSLYVR